MLCLNIQKQPGGLDAALGENIESRAGKCCGPSLAGHANALDSSCVGLKLNAYHGCVQEHLEAVTRSELGQTTHGPRLIDPSLEIRNPNMRIVPLVAIRILEGSVVAAQQFGGAREMNGEVLKADRPTAVRNVFAMLEIDFVEKHTAATPQA